MRILRTAHTPAPDPRLDAVLEGFRRHWLSAARRARPTLEADFDDAVQMGLLALIDPDVLATLEEPARIQGWGRALFFHKLATIARERGRERARRHPLPAHVESMLDWLAERVAAEEPSPEQQAIARERLGILIRCLQDLPMAQAKFLEDVPDKQLAERFGKTHAAVRNYLKRVRRLLRTTVAERS